MDVRDLMHELPPPDQAAVDRVRRRFRATREGQARRLPWAPLLAGGLAVAGAALAYIAWDPERTSVLDESGDVAWSEQVRLEPDGLGTARGTSRDLVVDWTAGTLRVEVAPQTGTRLAVVTEEGTVRVVGTAFTVKRDALGVTTAVEHGKVAVKCVDGWEGAVTAESGPHTCLPTRPGGLLGRAEALEGSGAASERILDALDRGLAVATPGSALESELLARRVLARSDAGLIGPALADADRYLASGHATRRVDVLRNAARVALAAEGCARAVPYLEPIGADAGGDDRAMLASCIPDRDRARELARAALNDPTMTPAWRTWARAMIQETP